MNFFIVLAKLFIITYENHKNICFSVFLTVYMRNFRIIFYLFLPKKTLLLFSQIPVFSPFPFYFLSSCHISKRTPFGGFAMSRKNIITGTLILTCANLITKCMGFFYRVFMSNAIAQRAWGCIS